MDNRTQTQVLNDFYEGRRRTREKYFELCEEYGTLIDIDVKVVDSRNIAREQKLIETQAIPTH